MSILSSLVAGGASLAGNIITNRSNKKENERTRQYNWELAQEQNRMNLEQWNRENAYNHPSALMARLRSSGLNPNLAYGMATGTSAGSPDLTAGSPATPVQYQDGVTPAVNTTLAAEQTQAQTSLIQEEKTLTHEKAETEKKQQSYTQQLIDLGAVNLRWQEKMNYATFEKIYADAEVLATSLKKTSAEISNLLLQNDLLVGQKENQSADTQLKKLDAQLKAIEIGYRPQWFKLELQKTALQNRELKLNVDFLSQSMASRLRYCYWQAAGQKSSYFGQYYSNKEQFNLLKAKQKQNFYTQYVSEMIENMYWDSANKALKFDQDFGAGYHGSSTKINRYTRTNGFFDKAPQEGIWILNSVFKPFGNIFSLK